MRDGHGAQVTGVPVIRSETDRTLVGILSKKDLGKSGATVGDIMSTPPVAARPTSTVADAAVLMLKHKARSYLLLIALVSVSVLQCPAACSSQTAAPCSHVFGKP